MASPPGDQWPQHPQQGQPPRPGPSHGGPPPGGGGQPGGYGQPPPYGGAPQRFGPPQGPPSAYPAPHGYAGPGQGVSPGPPQSRQARTGMIFAVVTVVGGLLTAIGSLLAWVTVQAPIFGAVSVAGTKGDGKITLVLGILVVVVGVLRLVRPSIPPLVQRLPIVLGLIAAALGIYVIIRLGSQLGEIEAFPSASVSIGFGLIMTIVGAVVSIVGGIVVSSVPPTIPGGVAGLGPAGR